MWRLRDLLEGLYRQIDVLHQTSTPYILRGDVDRRLRDIRAVALIFEFLLLAIVVIDTVEQLLVVIDPFLESELLAVNTRSDIEGDHRRLDQQGTRTTHGIHEIRLAFPACLQDHTCGQHLIQGRLRLGYPITALMQRLAGAIDRQRTIVM